MRYMLLLLGLFSLLPSFGMDENIVDPRLFSKLSFMERNTLWGPWGRQEFKAENGKLELEVGRGKKTLEADMPLLRDYMTAESLNISFDYRLKGTAEIRLKFDNNEKTLPSSRTVELAATAEWRKFEIVLPYCSEAESTWLKFICHNAGTLLEVKTVVITGNEPETANGKALKLDKCDVEAIFYLKTDVATTFYDRQAAQMLRYSLIKAGGRPIPVKTLEKADDYTRCAIFIGKAAEQSRILNRAELDDIKEGGYAMRQKNGRLAIAGARPSGVALGVLHYLRRLGIWYVGQNQFITDNDGDFASPGFAAALNPAIPARILHERFRRTELYGYNAQQERADFTMLGRNRNGVHALIRLTPPEELLEKHPEYLALQKDGKRLGGNVKRDEGQYCLSNPGYQKLVAERLMEMMKADPLARYYNLFPGDGGDRYCRCSECRKLGGYTDQLMFFTNAVAALIKPQFPDMIFTTAAYVDTYEPPKKYLPTENVIVEYCPYRREEWQSMLWYESPANDLGKRRQLAWEQAAPRNIGGFFYPVYVRERQHIWPAFYANVELYRNAAQKQYRLIDNSCGWTSNYAAGRVPQYGSFTDLSLVLMNDLMCNPNLNIESAINDFMKRYYGVAAVPMRRYFDLIQHEPAKRRWVQHCEVPVRGFVSPELAKSALIELNEAERLAGSDPRIRRNVLKEKAAMLWSDLTDNCRGRGNIAKADFSAYAKRLAEFVGISRELDQVYMAPEVKQWFWETAVLRLDGGGNWDGGTPWYDAPICQQLLKDPVHVLGASVPIVQETIDGGWKIAVEGMIGGNDMNSNWLRSDRVKTKVARRPSSGFGVVSAILRLEQPPAASMLLKIHGIDNEKKEPALVKIIINGQTIYQGDAPWKKDEWSECAIPIPANHLVVGDNEIQLLNLTPDKEAALDQDGGANFAAARDYTYGWFALDYLKIVAKK